NQGLLKRATFTRLSRRVHVSMPMPGAFFSITKNIVSGVDIDVKFGRSSAEFCVHAFQDGDNPQAYKVNIIDPTLWIYKAKVFPPLFVKHSQILEDEPAVYNITRRVTKPITITAGTTSYTVDNVSAGQLPKRIIYGFI